MANLLSKAVSIEKLGQRNLWVIWGKSGTGKTALGATFPKPMLYIQVGDDGSNTIADTEGVMAVRAESLADLKDTAQGLMTDKKYKTIFVDTFSMITNEWIDKNATQKNKKMTQQMWGEVKIDSEELIKIFHKLALSHIVVLSCHESNDSIEGMEDEILPDIRPSVTKGARTYLEGMANYGIHTTKLKKTIISKKTGQEKEVVRYAVHIGANPYYWTKLQINPGIQVPDIVINPTYDKLMGIIQG
jgi:hypothetical protein